MKDLDAPTAPFTVRCDDCGTEQALPREGGNLADCCGYGDLRRISIRHSNNKWVTYPNAKRDTVEGPPQLIWEQGTDSYGLYAGGNCLTLVHGSELQARSAQQLTLINRLLALVT